MRYATPAAMPSHLSGRPAENSMITAIIRYWIAMPVSPDETHDRPHHDQRVQTRSKRKSAPFGDMTPRISVMCAAIVKMKISLPSSPGCRLVTPRLSHARWPLTSVPSGVNSRNCRQNIARSRSIFHRSPQIFQVDQTERDKRRQTENDRGTLYIQVFRRAVQRRHRVERGGVDEAPCHRPEQIKADDRIRYRSVFFR